MNLTEFVVHGAQRGYEFKIVRLMLTWYKLNLVPWAQNPLKWAVLTFFFLAYMTDLLNIFRYTDLTIAKFYEHIFNSPHPEALCVTYTGTHAKWNIHKKSNQNIIFFNSLSRRFSRSHSATSGWFLQENNITHWRPSKPRGWPLRGEDLVQDVCKWRWLWYTMQSKGDWWSFLAQIGGLKYIGGYESF